MREDSNAAITNKHGIFLIVLHSWVTLFPDSRRPAVKGQTRGVNETVRPNKQKTDPTITVVYLKFYFT